MSKKNIREEFRNNVFKRDKYSCRVCGHKSDASNAIIVFDAHHICDRSKIINGGYVKENGITVCKTDCHYQVEQFHISEGEYWEPGLHPDDLYAIIGSSKELAIEKSMALK